MGRPVVLIGMMGSGKTAVGKELARLMRRPWLDLDHELEREWGASVPEQFQRAGEAEFRKRERALLKRLARGARVLSAGGGVVLDPGNRALLKKLLAVYLQASPEALARRLKGPQAAKRPLLKNGDVAGVLRRLAAQRGTLYRSCASLSVRAGMGSPQAVAARIFKRLRGVDSAT